MKNNKICLSLNICTQQSMDFPIKDRFEAFQDFCSLIQEWNKYAKLVSHNDAQISLPIHCADSISLAPTVHTLIQDNLMEYWDLGTGGGFPAIAISILNPELPTRLIERNTKKCTFLRKVCNRLSLKQVTIENQSFSTLTRHDTPRIFTSRAIEKPELVMPQILDSLSLEDVYLCQSESIHQLALDQLKMFHVEPIKDEFSESGLRRNKLYKVMRKF